jgi:flagellar hook-length control protein FliK
MSVSSPTPTPLPTPAPASRRPSPAPGRPAELPFSDLVGPDDASPPDPASPADRNPKAQGRPFREDGQPPALGLRRDKGKPDKPHAKDATEKQPGAAAPTATDQKTATSDGPAPAAGGDALAVLAGDGGAMPDSEDTGPAEDDAGQPEADTAVGAGTVVAAPDPSTPVATTPALCAPPPTPSSEPGVPTDEDGSVPTARTVAAGHKDLQTMPGKAGPADEADEAAPTPFAKDDGASPKGKAKAGDDEHPAAAELKVATTARPAETVTPATQPPKGPDAPSPQAVPPAALPPGVAPASANGESGKDAVAKVDEPASKGDKASPAKAEAAQAPASLPDGQTLTVTDLRQPPGALRAGSADMPLPASTPGHAGTPRVPDAVPVNAVAVEIGLRALSGSQSFQIRLHPEDLGRVDVKLDIGSDGSVKAVVSADRPDTLALLQRDQRSLERAFEQAGLKPSDAGVQYSLADGTGRGGEQAARDQQNNGRGGRPGLPMAEAPGQQIAALARGIRLSTSGLDITV